MMKHVISVEQNRYQPFFLALNQRCTEGSGLLYAIFLPSDFCNDGVNAISQGNKNGHSDQTQCVMDLITRFAIERRSK
jgi:hypothetical protein